MPRVTQQQQRTKGGDLGVYARLLPTVYIMPLLLLSPPLLSPSLHPLARPPSNSPHRPYSPHRYSLPAPLGVSQRRCRVLHNSRAPLPLFYRRRATLPCWTGVPCRVRSASACLPACLACLLLYLPTYLSTHQNLAKLTLKPASTLFGHYHSTLERSFLFF